MNKEYLEAFRGFKYGMITDNAMCITKSYFDDKFPIIEQALERLEAIDNVEPSEALECLEDIYRNGVFISDYDVFGKQHPTNISPETNKSISVQCDTIKQALLKAQYHNSKNIFKGSKKVKIEIPESSLMDYNPVNVQVEKSLKALEIIKDLLGRHCKIELVNGGTYYQIKIKIMGSGYSFGMSITKEEFDTLKEVLE